MTTFRRLKFNGFTKLVVVLTCITCIRSQNSELFESAEFPNSQYDVDLDYNAKTQLQFAPPLPTTKSPRPAPPLLGPDDNTLMSSSSSSASTSYTEFNDVSINSERILRSSESPYSVREHITVEKNGKLIIEPGVRLEFAPTVGITVRGILHAVVSFLYFSTFKLITYKFSA